MFFHKITVFRLYDMGFRSFERLFNHRPQLMAAMGLPSDETWKKNEKIKKIVLSLEQVSFFIVSGPFSTNFGVSVHPESHIKSGN